MDQNQTPRPEITTGHHAATSGATYVLRRSVEGAPFSRSDCWLPGCREQFGPYLTVRLFLGRTEPVIGEPIYISAACHGEFARPSDLTAEAREWLLGQP